METNSKGAGADIPLVAEFDGFWRPPMVVGSEGFWRPPLLAGLDGVWAMPLASLPKRLQQPVKADPVLRAHWDWLHPRERRLLVEQQDAQRDPGQQRQEADAFDREAQRQALEAEHLAMRHRRDRYERVKTETVEGMDIQDKNLARLDAKLVEIGGKLAAIDREQVAAEKDFGLTEQLAAAGGKVEPQTMAVRGPTLTTDEVCDAFDGIGLLRPQWQQRLTKDRPEWLLKRCLAKEGKRGHGGEQAVWLVMSIAKALVLGAGRLAPVPVRIVDAAFRSRPLLSPWSAQWRQVRQDNPLWGD